MALRAAEMLQELFASVRLIPEESLVKKLVFLALLLSLSSLAEAKGKRSVASEASNAFDCNHFATYHVNANGTQFNFERVASASDRWQSDNFDTFALAMSKAWQDCDEHTR